MNFELFFVILICSVRFTLSDRFTPADVHAMHWDPNLKVGHALINYTGKEMLCFHAWNWNYYPEIPYVYLYCDSHLEFPENKPSLTDCSGYDCWESQLSLVTRIEIVEIMNRYRNLVAEGTCETWCENNIHKLAFELRWNYFLEQNATGYLRTCAASKFMPKVFTNVIRADGSSLSPAYKELILTSFKMETGLQSELRSILWRLMYENHLKDWDEKSQFRRGDMIDMACAFVCRRNVDLFVTALNETVVNGIVGHFSCVFLTILVNHTDMDNVTYDEPVPRPFNTTPKPSLQNCVAIIQSAFIFGAELNYYPALCKLNPLAYLPEIILFDACDYRPRDLPNVCQGSAYSPITWEEKFYGLVLRFIESFPNKTTSVDIQGQCNVPPPTLPQTDKYGPNIMNYYCTLKEIVAVPANPKLCSGWNCADSQLTEATKVQIIQLLNDARNRIAKGDCSDECAQPCWMCNINIQYCSMIKLQWHWFLERKASEVVKNCPTNNSIWTDFSYDDDPFPANHETYYEQITLIFDLPYYEGQLALPKTFIKLFWLNAFGDWTKFGYFRRANAQYIGCSIISRPYTLEDVEIEPEMNFYNGHPIHMVCIYASLNGSSYSVLGEPNDSCCPSCVEKSYVNPCWLEFRINSSPFESLCSADDQLSISMNCQIGKRCEDDSISKAWYIQYEGLTVAQTINGSLIPIDRLAFNSIGVVYERKYCRYIVFLFLQQIWLWILILYLIYNYEDINIQELLKKTLTPKFEFSLPKFTLPKKSTSSSKDKRDGVKAGPSFRTKKPKKGTFHDVESTREIPSSGISPDSDKTDAESVPPKKTKKRTLPPEIRTTPAVKKVRIREASSEDVDDESEWEPLTGPTKVIGVGVIGPTKIFTGRPPKDRKAPKRAKTTPLPPIFVKRAKK